MSEEIKSEKQEDASKGLYACVDTFEEAEAIIREYEIKHIVRFSTVREQKAFNIGDEPWRPKNGKMSNSRLFWETDHIPFTNSPFMTVARKDYDCQYGKQRKLGKPNIPTSKINCPCTISIAEVLRLTSPKPEERVLTYYRKKILNDSYRAQMLNCAKGLPHNLEWKREFHMRIGPLSTHNHVIGEGAAAHQRIDPLLRNRIHELAASGIVTLDVIRDHLTHYVEEELFKGKELPLKTNRRFYPASKDIHNHVEKMKSRLKIKKSSAPRIVASETEIATTSITNNGVVYPDNIDMVQVDRYVAVQHCESQNYQQYDQRFKEQTTLSTDTEQVNVSSFLNTENNQQACTTTKPVTKGAKPSRKDRSLSLIKKLYRVTDAIDSDQDLIKLTQSLISTLMVAKSMIPSDKTEVLFEEEPRVLMHPRRIRTYNRKPTPRRQRYPDINPNAVKPLDKKTLKAEELKRKAAARALKKEFLVSGFDSTSKEESNSKVEITNKVESNSKVNIKNKVESSSKVERNNKVESIGESNKSTEGLTKRKAVQHQSTSQPAPKVLMLSSSNTTPIQIGSQRVTVQLVPQGVSTAGTNIQTIILKPASNHSVTASPSTTSASNTPSYRVISSNASAGADLGSLPTGSLPEKWSNNTVCGTAPHHVVSTAAPSTSTNDAARNLISLSTHAASATADVPQFISDSEKKQHAAII